MRSPRARTSIATALMLGMLCGLPTLAWAQASDPHAVQPERPSVATHAGTVAPGWVELESGGEWDRFTGHVHGSTVSLVGKIGLSPRIQLSVFGLAVAPPDSGIRLGDMAVGVKWRIADHAPLLGRFAILPTLKMPTGSSASGAGTGTTDEGLLLISSHDLGPVAFDANVGYTHRSGSGATTPMASTVWAAAFGGPAYGAIGWVAEIFGLPPTAGPAGQDNTVAILLGPTLAVRPWLALDAGIVDPLRGPQPHALYVGGVWNVGRLPLSLDARQVTAPSPK